MRLILTLTALATLAGCSDATHATLHERAVSTAELISDKPACAAFARRLAEPAVTDRQITETYEAAKASKCIRPDV